MYLTYLSSKLLPFHSILKLLFQRSLSISTQSFGFRWLYTVYVVCFLAQVSGPIIPHPAPFQFGQLFPSSTRQPYISKRKLGQTKKESKTIKKPEHKTPEQIPPCPKQTQKKTIASFTLKRQNRVCSYKNHIVSFYRLYMARFWQLGVCRGKLCEKRAPYWTETAPRKTCCWAELSPSATLVVPL